MTKTDRFRAPVAVLLLAPISALLLVLSGSGARPASAQTALPAGEAWAWGYNAQGQLGDGTSGNYRTTPVQVGGSSTPLIGVVDVAGNGRCSLALKNDGTVWAWGYNGYAQLGDGTTTNRTTPVQVIGLSDIKAVAASEVHSLALKNGGTVWAWGYNAGGQLGDGTTTSHTTSVQVTSGTIDVRVYPLTGVKAIAAGGDYSLVLKHDGTVWGWGENINGQLGDGTSGLGNYRITPVQVSGLTDVKAIAGGAAHSLAVKNDGTAWGWGSNLQGQLGDGTTTSRTTPVQVSGLTNVIAVAGGWYHSLAAKYDTTAPDAPLIIGPPNSSYDTDGNITFSGTAEANSAIELFEGTASKGTTMADASGNWSVALSGVAEGSHTYIARATDASGNTSGQSDALTVIVDKTAPTVSSVAPTDGKTGGARSTNVTVTFSEAMDPATLVTDKTNQTSTTVRLFKAGSPTPVPAKVTVSSDGKTVTLDPYGSSTQKLAKRTTYTVRISGAKDRAGNSLVGNDPSSGDYVWSFKTGRR